MSDIIKIKNFPTLLELNPTRIPTVQEYKKAFREKLKLHPDLGGDKRSLRLTPIMSHFTTHIRRAFTFHI